MPATRRTFDDAFKLKAVSLAESLGNTKAADQLGLSKGLLYNWRTGRYGAGAPKPKPKKLGTTRLVAIKTTVPVVATVDTMLQEAMRNHRFIKELVLLLAKYGIGR